MKKLFLSVPLVFVVAGMLYGGGVEENSNQSAEYMKTLNRYASTDSDASYYNPAGTAFMDEGTYLYLSSQTILIPIEIRGHSLTRSVYRGEKTSYCTPNLYLVYNKENIGSGAGDLAWSIGVMAIGGGGFGKYPNGLSYIDNTLLMLRGSLNSLFTGLGIPYSLGTVMTSKFDGTSAYYSAMTNVAYSFLDDRLAVSAGYRFMYGLATYDAKLYSDGILIPVGGDFHARQDGVAHGIILGISAIPIESVTIGFKFEYNSPFRLKTKSSGYYIVGMVDSSLMDGGEAHRQHPMNASIGLSYRIKGVQLSWSYSYYLNRFAQWKGKEDHYLDGFEAGMGIDYTFSTVPLNIGCGYVFSYGGARDSVQTQISEMPNGHTIGAGISYTFKEMVKLTVAFGYIHWMTVDVNKGTNLGFLPADFDKKGYDIAIGAELKVK